MTLDAFQIIHDIRLAFQGLDTPFARLIKDTCDKADELVAVTDDPKEREQIALEYVETLERLRNSIIPSEDTNE